MPYMPHTGRLILLPNSNGVSLHTHTKLKQQIKIEVFKMYVWQAGLLRQTRRPERQRQDNNSQRGKTPSGFVNQTHANMTG